MVSRSTAGRYVQRARERGFLKPTRQRVAGQDRQCVAASSSAAPRGSVVYDEPSRDGKRRQRMKGRFGTRREAQAFLTEQVARLDGVTYAARAK
jgi:hypothetical protein